MCQKKRQAGVKGVKTIKNFFAKATTRSASGNTSSIQTESNDNDQDQFEGLDAIVSEK